MMIQAIGEAVVSCFDINRITTPLVQACGYRHVPLADAPAAQFAAWKLPATCTRIEQALLIPPAGPDARGSIRLVRFHGVDQKLMRSSQRSWDTGGIFDVDMLSADVDRVYRDLQRFGWTAFGEPVDYSEAHYSVRQVVAIGPDGLILAIIQRYEPPVTGLEPNGALSQVFNSTQIVADFDAAARFYVETLGWTCRLDFMVEGVAEPGADVIGLPMPHAVNARRRIGMFDPPGSAEGGVELIQNLDMYGRRFDKDCTAPNIGILSLRFEVDDAALYAEQIVGRGGALRTKPAPLLIEPYGQTVHFSVRSPEGAIIEFHSIS